MSTALTPDPGTGCTGLVGRGLVKRYGTWCAIGGVDLAIRPGDMLVIEGPPGAGKTTLLHILAGIVVPDGGEVMLGRHRIDRLPEARRTELRRRDFGVVAQKGTLSAELTVAENVALPLLLTGVRRALALSAARDWLACLGLARCDDRMPGELSSGQVQRVKIARALVHQPAVIFADEPTGPLDIKVSAATLDVLMNAAADMGAALVVATRDRALAATAPRSVQLRDGLIVGGVLAG